MAKRFTDSDRQPAGALDDAEDLQRRCAAHGEWMASHPEVVALAASWAHNNLEALPRR